MDPTRLRRSGLPRGLLAAACLLLLVPSCGRVEGAATGRPGPPASAPPGPTAPSPELVEQTLGQGAPEDEAVWRSPMHVCTTRDGSRAFVVNRTWNSVATVDLGARAVTAEIAVGARPSYAVLSADERRLFVACSYDSRVDVVDLEDGRVVRRFEVGFEPVGLCLSPDGERLTAVNFLADTVSILDAGSGALRCEVPVGRRPRYAADTGDRLVVGNAHSRDVTILNPRTGRVLETRSLDRGAQLREVAVTRDGRWAIVATLVGHDEQITTQMDRGWINSNGFSVLDLHREGHFVTLLLDRVLTGATNPWGLAIPADQRHLYVTLAGIHQLAIVDLPGVLRLVEATAPAEVQRLSQDVEILERRGLARRVDAGGLGPRSAAVVEGRGEVLVTNYFSDTVTVLDAASGAVKATIRLGPERERSLWREGELRFNDGRICFENWLSCASCHQENGTMDSLNWDLINDGMGNPKNAKSMHDGIFSAPAMWSGVRADQHVGTMAGQRFLGFLPDDDVQRALMEFIGRPHRAPNPYRQVAAEVLERGRRVFQRARCDVCHPPPAFTDRRMHDVGLRGFTSDADFRSRFDTPSLLECYRTGPWLHDGRADTLREIFTRHDPGNAHGLTRGLSARELDDLVAYLMSL